MTQEDKMVEFLVELPKSVDSEFLMEVIIPVTSQEWDEVVESQCRFSNAEHHAGLIFKEDSPTLYAKIINEVISVANRVEGEGYLMEEDGWFEINCPWDFHDDPRLQNADAKREEMRIANRVICRTQFHETSRILKEQINSGRWPGDSLDPNSIASFGGWKSDFIVGIKTSRGLIDYSKDFPNTEDPTPICQIRFTWNEHLNSLLDGILSGNKLVEYSLKKIDYNSPFSQSLYIIKDPNNVSLELVCELLDAICIKE